MRLQPFFFVDFLMEFKFVLFVGFGLLSKRDNNVAPLQRHLDAVGCNSVECNALDCNALDGNSIERWMLDSAL